MKMMKFFTVWLLLGMAWIISAGFVITNTSKHAQAQDIPTKSDVVAAMYKVNNYWKNTSPDRSDSWWHNKWSRATYFTGDMAHYFLTNDLLYLSFAKAWAENHEWKLNGGCKNHWKSADDQCAGQTYIELYKLDPDPSKISCIITSIKDSKEDDWWWIDAMYMAMPVYAELGNLYPNDDYFDMMHERYTHTKWSEGGKGLYDDDAGLWYRDKDYIYPKEPTPGGKKTFWSRGNGWVFAAHARVLEILPPGTPHREEYLETFRSMAAALKEVQGADGYWNVSLFDPDDYGGPETSGTAFFTYGMAWGINNGYLERSEYEPVVIKAWNWMVNEAIHLDGKLGYVQGGGNSPSSSQPVTYDNTEDFGVGAFLLAGSEVYKLAAGPPLTPDENLALNKSVTCSSEPEPENGCDNAVDGDLDSRWSAWPWTQWIEVDLGAVHNIDRVRVYPRKSRAYQYYVEVKSNPADSYTTAVDRSNNTEGGVVFEDSDLAIEARYVRLIVTGAHNYGGEWVSFPEFEVFGSDSTYPIFLPKILKNAPD